MLFFKKKYQEVRDFAEFEEIAVKNIKYVIELMDKYAHKRKNKPFCSEEFNKLVYYITDVVKHYHDDYFVAHPLIDEVENLYNKFFTSLYNLLISIKNNELLEINEKERSFANKTLCHKQDLYKLFPLYAIELENKNGKPIIKCNNHWTVWSTKKDVGYINDKLHDPIIVHSEAKEMYGIDLKAFGLENDKNKEIVFPLIQKSLKETTFKYKKQNADIVLV